MSVTWDKLVGVLILLWTFIYTVSYASWTWKEKNRLGAIMVLLVAIAVIGLPIYTLFFKT